MHVITLACSDCGTIVAANELELNRIMKCPGTSCDAVLRFADLPSEDREHFLDNHDRYQI